MTLNSLLSQVGIGTKQISERYSEYGGPADQHIFYTYEPPQTHAHGPIPKHSYGGLKSNSSMSALTLLAFLFFLHILQQCINEQMNDMNSTPIMVMSAGKEAEAEIPKSFAKFDKAGYDENKNGYKSPRKHNQIYLEKNPFDQFENNENLMKIKVAEYTPKADRQKYQYVYKSYANLSSMNPGFVTADDN